MTSPHPRRPDSPPPLSPLSDYSLVSSLDALSFSTDSFASARSTSTGVHVEAEAQAPSQTHSRRVSGSSSSSFAYISDISDIDSNESVDARTGSVGGDTSGGSDNGRDAVPELTMPALEVSTGKLEGSGGESESEQPSASATPRPNPAVNVNVNDAEVDAEVDAAATTAKRKTRRSGIHARRRVDNGLVREENEVDSVLGDVNTTPRGRETPRPVHAHVHGHEHGQGDSHGDTPRNVSGGTASVSSSFSSSSSSEVESSDGYSDSDDDEVEALTDLALSSGQTTPTASASASASASVSARASARAHSGHSEQSGSSGRPGRNGRERSGQLSYAGSIISAEDAHSSIDDFLAEPNTYLDRDAKLRLWQSLCFELGLAYFDDPFDMPIPDLPDLPNSLSLDSSSSSSPDADSPNSPATPRARNNPLPLPSPTSHAFTPIPMPQSLNKVYNLLHSHGHVNISDYFAERERDLLSNHTAGTYAHLVHPSASAMCRYTRKHGKFVPLSQAKSEALQPLLRTFRYGR